MLSPLILVYANTTIIATLANITLTRGNSKTVTITWDTASFAKGNYTISAHATPVPDETRTSDNTLTDGWVIVALVGDITGPEGHPDGRCDMWDVGLVARLFGKKYPDPMYQPNCDVVYDLKIEMRDVGTIARHFVETDP